MALRETFRDLVVTTLSADASAGAKQVSVVGTTGLATSGQWRVRIGTPTTGTRPNASVEWHTVTKVVGTTLYLAEALAIDHDTGEEVAPIFNRQAVERVLGIYAGGHLVENASELNFDPEFTVRVSDQRARVRAPRVRRPAERLFLSANYS